MRSLFGSYAQQLLFVFIPKVEIPHAVIFVLLVSEVVLLGAQGGLSVAGGCRCLTKDGNTSIEKEGYIPYPLQA